VEDGGVDTQLHERASRTDGAAGTVSGGRGRRLAVGGATDRRQDPHVVHPLLQGRVLGERRVLVDPDDLLEEG
jgi:hypothetical protein